VRAYDFDFLLSVDDPELYYRVHAYAWQGDPQVVNYLGGTDVGLVLRILFLDEAWLAGLDRRFPATREHVARIRGFVCGAVERILAGGPDEVWLSTYVSNLWLSMLAARTLHARAETS